MSLLSACRRLSVVFPALVILMVSGCGEFSVYDLLETEESGDFAMSQSVINLQPTSSFTLAARGGFREYTFDVVSEPGTGTVQPETGFYTAPDVVPPDGTAVVRASDRFGTRDTTTIRIHQPLSAASFVMIAQGPSFVEIPVNGGFGEKFVVSTELENDATVIGDVLSYTPLWAGTDYVEIADQADNVVGISIRVYTPTELLITPSNALTTYGSGLTGFTVHGGTTPYSLSPIAPEDGGAVLVGEALSYTPPATGAGTMEIRLIVTDSSGQDVEATVVVVSAEPAPLMISPSGVSATNGTTLEFSASGGVPPYTFERVGPGSGQPVVINATTARYTVSFPPGSAQIRLTDHTGNYVTAKINVAK